MSNNPIAELLEIIPAKARDFEINGRRFCYRPETSTTSESLVTSWAGLPRNATGRKPHILWRNVGRLLGHRFRHQPTEAEISDLIDAARIALKGGGWKEPAREGLSRAIAQRKNEREFTGRFNIRCKEFDFAIAPDLSSRADAAYVPAVRTDTGLEKSNLRFNRAIDAAVEAARMCHEAIRSGQVFQRAAYVGCEYEGERPSGAMKDFAYVSYRPR